MQNVADKDAQRRDPEQQLEQIGAADVVVGIPTYNSGETVGRSIEAAAGASSEWGAGARLALIQADGGSRDGDVEHVREVVAGRIPLAQTTYPVYPADRLAAPTAGVPGRTEAALQIFRLARQLNAKVCVLLDAAVETVSPQWIGRLTRPVLDDAVDLVVPSYRRHRFDGLINSGIVSPFVRALFGKRLRQPSGADLAFSAALMDYYVGQSAADRRPAAAVDPFSVVPVVTHGFRAGQTYVGPRVAPPREAPPDLGGILTQALGEVFGHMEHTAAIWQKVRGSEPTPWFGPPPEFEANGAEFSRQPMIAAFRQGCHNLLDIWKFVLPPAVLLELRRMEKQTEAEFRFPDNFWARVVYDFALGYHSRVMSRDHLLKAFAPLYLGWAASFTGEMEDADAGEVEGRLDRLGERFEAEKRYLISRWRWPDRFNP